MKNYFLMVFLLILSEMAMGQDILAAIGQDSARVMQLFTGQFGKDEIIHVWYAGYWGEDTTSKKHFILHQPFDSTNPGEYQATSVIYTKDTNGDFDALEIDYEFWGAGVYPWNSGVAVTALDVDTNGFRELIMRESGIVRCEVEIYETDTSETPVWMTASCDYSCYFVYREVTDKRHHRMELVDDAYCTDEERRVKHLPIELIDEYIMKQWE